MSPYKTTQFALGEIPRGLQRDHQLKEGTRAELTVTKGTLGFVNHQGEKRTVVEGETVHIEPRLVHHLEDASNAAIEIAFYRITDPV